MINMHIRIETKEWYSRIWDEYQEDEYIIRAQGIHCLSLNEDGKKSLVLRKMRGVKASYLCNKVSDLQIPVPPLSSLDK